MKEKTLKTISLLLLLFVLIFSIGLIIYPKYPGYKILINQLNTQQITNNTMLSFFSTLAYPSIAGVTTQQGSPNTVEHISTDKLEKYRKKYGVVQLELEDTILEISSVDIEGRVVDGDDANAMDRGFWHYPLSTPPGRRGNTIIIGHRFLHIPPRKDTFFNLDKVQVGDNITLKQKDNEYSYTVIQTFVVDKNDISVLENTRDYRLTLITCTPLWSSEERLIIIGKMDRVYGNI